LTGESHAALRSTVGRVLSAANAITHTLNASFISWPQKGKAGGNNPAGSPEEDEIRYISIFLPLIIVILEVKVKITWKTIIRKQG
jgi:hypothetical protein